MEWTSDEFVDWICSLEEDKYMKYENALRSAFKKDGVCGALIPDIEKNDWIPWGIRVLRIEVTFIIMFRF